MALDRNVPLFGIVNRYLDAQTADCKTRGLTLSIDGDRLLQWRFYLVAYTNAVAGCAPEYGIVPGGILAFGPANTMAIGIARGPLAANDVAPLIDHYLAPFADSLALSSEETDLVRATLQMAANKEIDSSESSTLSTCKDGGD